MDITWKEILLFFIENYGYSQTQLGKYLDCHKSTVSKILSGKTHQMRFSLNEIYDKLFNTDTNGSPVYSSIKVSLLNSLIEFFREKGFGESIEPLTKSFENRTKTDDDYKPFVDGLLKLAKVNESSNQKHAKKDNKGITQSDDTDPSTELLPHVTPTKTLRDYFVEIVNDNGVMEIINRKPAKIYRKDSAKISICIEEIEALLNTRVHRDDDEILHADIQLFRKKLRIRELMIEAALNNRFKYDDYSASINMDGSGRSARWKKKSYIPKLDKKLIRIAADAVGILETTLSDWKGFREEMNLLYTKICGFYANPDTKQELIPD